MLSEEALVKAVKRALLSQSDDVWAFNATAKASTTLFGSEGF